MDFRSVARKALRDVLTQDCGVSISAASEMASGKKKPSLGKAVEIQNVTGIPASEWIGGDPGMFYLASLATKAAVNDPA